MRRNLRQWIPVLVASWLATASGAMAEEARMLTQVPPGDDPNMLSLLGRELSGAGFRVAQLPLASLLRSGVPESTSMLIVPDASRVPPAAVGRIEVYLKKGGDLIALRTPFATRMVVRHGDRWLTPDDYRAAQAGESLQHVVLDYEDLEAWKQSVHGDAMPGTFELSDDCPVVGRRSLHVSIPRRGNWNTLLSPRLDQPFGSQRTLTVFSAKGSENTDELMVEWVESDGSRWIAVVPLDERWKRFVLAPEEFRYWPSVPARSRSRFNPSEAVEFRVGLARSHTGYSDGPHEYWISPVGTARADATTVERLDNTLLPRIDALCPSDKFFACRDTARLVGRSDQVILDDGEYPLPDVMLSPHPRTRGAGFDKGRAWRWMPLLEARAADGAWRGTPGVLWLHSEGTYQGAAIASFSVQDEHWYGRPRAMEAIGRVAGFMRSGTYLLDGGADHYTYFEDQRLRIGARIVHQSAAPAAEGKLKVTLRHPTSGEVAFERIWPVNAPEGETEVLDAQTAWPDAGTESYDVEARLILGDRCIDRLRHRAHLCQPSRAPEFITVDDGDFVRNGRRWRIFGINYMPSSGLACEDRDYFEHWIGARAYDPEVVDRDLDHIRDIGFNAVSIFVDHRVARDQNLLDLLRRLADRGIHANLNIRPGTPMDFQWDKVREVIEFYRLKDNDTVFAYDLAWEPDFGQYGKRRRWDAEWRAWILEQYGTVDNAENDWDFSVPRTPAGAITSPSDRQTTTDGPHRRMVAAYRRFLDVLLYRKYGEARRLVKSIDPNHHVSFRMSNAGNPTFNWEGRLPYDFPYLAGAVDFLGPEAYGRIGDWDTVKPGWFEYEYARWANPALPMVWTEMGVSAWSKAANRSTQAGLRFQADFYRDFFRMMIESGADGVLSWWYPGGFRYGENSDYGIINPDGTDRPVTRVLREMGPRLLNGPDAPTVDQWLVFDRDQHADGIVGVYRELKDAFWQTIDEGRHPGLKTAGTGTTSADCPLVGVGNVPCTGQNPPKYLDAVFDEVRVQDRQGRWVHVDNGGEVEVRSDAPAMARLVVTNLNEATWLASSGASGRGQVRLTIQGAQADPLPVRHDVARFESVAFESVPLSVAPLTEPCDITLRMGSSGRTLFGQTFRLRLKPAR